jgi:hypothetical protein
VRDLSRPCIHVRHLRHRQFIHLLIHISFFFPFHFNAPKAKGLPPLPDPSVAAKPSDDAKNSKTNHKEASLKENKSLSFASSSSHSSRPTTATAKRKAAIIGDEDADHDTTSRVRVGGASSSKVKAKKKPKVGLSFADDA